MYYLEIIGLEDEVWNHVDRDEVMLHAAFQVLIDYVDKEKPGEAINWSSDKEHEGAWSEIQSLYKWWKEERPARIDPVDEIDIPDDYMVIEDATENGKGFGRVIFNSHLYPEVADAFELSRKIEIEWYKEDQRNLHRLIEVRSYLWT